jgi:hypothetical protein
LFREEDGEIVAVTFKVLLTMSDLSLLKLKLELGSAFYQLGFDKMGEELSLQWTDDEEKVFKDAMRSNIPY